MVVPKVVKITKPSKEDWHIFIQEIYETTGHATQLDEEFVELLYKRLFEVK